MGWRSRAGTRARRLFRPWRRPEPARPTSHHHPRRCGKRIPPRGVARGGHRRYAVSDTEAAMTTADSGPGRYLKADLHVHSYHSGYSTSLRLFRSRDSYSDPEEIYRLAKARGMDLVTITDHDSIDGCLELLDRHPDREDFIVGEEIECVLRHFSAMEARNGTMLSAQNDLVERILDDAGRSGNCLARFGGSDAHILRRVATTYTEAPASSREEFLESLRQGRSRVGGRHGSTCVLASEIHGVIFNYWASLLGLRRHDLLGYDRLRDIGLSAVSLPFQFIPFLVAAAKKTAESRRLARLLRRWLAYVEADLPRDAALSLDTPFR